MSRKFGIGVQVLIVALFCAVIIVPAWVQPIQMWDEASYVNNALELVFGGANPLILQNHCEPNLYNVKPPFAVWLFGLSAKLFGVREFWFRLPTVAAAGLTCGLVYWFAKKHFDVVIALASVIVLLSTEGYVRGHVTQTADPDGVLILFTTAYTLLYIDYVVTDRRNGRRLMLMAGLVVLAFYTKSVTAFFFLPGLALATAAVGGTRLVFSDWRPYVFGIGGLLLCVGFYALREWILPGYWSVVYASEYLRFVTNVMPWHSQPWYFYIEGLYSRNYFPFCFALLAWPLTLYASHGTRRKILLMLMIACVGFFSVISYPEVKLEFYDAPVYPLFAILVASTIKEGLARMGFAPSVAIVSSFAIVTASGVWPAKRIIQKGWTPTASDPLMANGFALKQMREAGSPITHLKVLHCPQDLPHLDQALFYAKAYRFEGDADIQLLYDASQLKPGDRFLSIQPSSVDYAKALFDVTILREFEWTILYHVGARRQATPVINGEWPKFPIKDCL